MKTITTLVALLFALAVSVPAYALSPSVKIDMLKAQLVEQLKGKDYASAVQTMQDLKATGTKLPSSFEYFEGKALFESGQQAASYDKFAHYTETQGKNSKYYKDAIAYLIKAEKAHNAALVWKHLFGGRGDDGANAIVQTADGGYAVAGVTASKGAGKKDAWVIRIDAKGKVLWDRTFGDVNSDGANSIVQTQDGGFIVAGWGTPKGKDENYTWVIRLDAQGQRLWDRTFVGSGYEDEETIIQTADGGFALAISYFLNDSTFDLSYYYKLLVVRMDHEGKVLWDRTFGDIDIDSYGYFAYTIVQTSDSGFVLAGLSRNNDPKGDLGEKSWVVRMDHEGKVLWNRTYDASSKDYFTGVVQTADGSLVLAGSAYNESLKKFDARVVRINIEGKVLWGRTYNTSNSGHDYAAAIVQTTDGGFVFAGVTESKGAGKSDAFVVWLTRNGEVE